MKNTIVEKESHSVLSHKDDDSQKSRRVSTVSWGVPNYEESHSQEQVSRLNKTFCDKKCLVESEVVAFPAFT